MRSDFEKWFNDKATWKITASMRTKDGYVNNPSAQSKWEVWQASRAAIEVELDSHTEFEIEHMIQPEEDGYAKGWIDGRNYSEKRIRAAGLRVKEK